MSRQYEAVYVFDSQLEDGAITDRLGRFHALLGKAEDLQVNHWGRRQLAFPIKRRESGYYVVARFGVDSEVLPSTSAASSSTTESCDTCSRCTSTSCARLR